MDDRQAVDVGLMFCHCGPRKDGIDKCTCWGHPHVFKLQDFFLHLEASLGREGMAKITDPQSKAVMF
jgi:hypothetical protein